MLAVTSGNNRIKIASMDDITKQALINRFIDESFRDSADKDYICARVSYRYGLVAQFYWSALQAIEKYLKAILLYNRKNAKKLGHEISKAYTKVLTINDINFRFPKNINKYLAHIEEQGGNRYFEYPRNSYGQELPYLDKTVWHIRQYCFFLRTVALDNGKLKDQFPVNIKEIERNIIKGPTMRNFAFRGTLEDILCDGTSKLREPLVWENFYFGSYKKKVIRFRSLRCSANPIHVLHPEIYPELAKMVDFSRSVRDYFTKKP